jgi:hypothetical protein
MQCALDPHIVVGFQNFPYDYGRFLGRQLGHLADATEFAEFAAICSDNQQWNRWHAILLHEALRHNRRIDLRGVTRQLSEVGNPASNAILFTIKEIGDSVLAEHILTQAQRCGNIFRQQALEALTSIKHACVREFCVQRLKKSRDVTERGPLYRCLASLVDEASVGLLERGERRGDYDPDLFDLSHALLIVKIILSGDTAGTEEESRMLADIDRRERKERDEMLSSLERFLNSSS